MRRMIPAAAHAIVRLSVHDVKISTKFTFLTARSQRSVFHLLQLVH